MCKFKAICGTIPMIYHEKECPSGKLWIRGHKFGLLSDFIGQKDAKKVLKAAHMSYKYNTTTTRRKGKFCIF